ncbi:MAG: hypothetical protein ABJC51_02155, partial [Acidobacteriota bacterium]
MHVSRLQRFLDDHSRDVEPNEAESGSGAAAAPSEGAAGAAMRLSSHALFQRLARPLAPADDVPPAPPRIMIVDDDPGVRAFLVRALSMVESEAFVANSGADAMQLFDSAAPIDLLVS